MKWNDWSPYNHYCYQKRQKSLQCCLQSFFWASVSICSGKSLVWVCWSCEGWWPSHLWKVKLLPQTLQLNGFSPVFLYISTECKTFITHWAAEWFLYHSLTLFFYSLLFRFFFFSFRFLLLFQLFCTFFAIQQRQKPFKYKKY